PLALERLSYCYYYGIGVRKDYKKSFELCKLSAEAGCALGLFATGFCYQYGHGVAKNDQLALKCYLEASNKGNTKAQYSLGYVYCYGELGLQKDFVKSLEYYKKSSLQGSLDALNTLGTFYE